MSHWYDRSFRKVHTLFVSPAWVRDRGRYFDAERLADQYAAAGTDCVQFYCKDHHGTTYFPCSLGLQYPRNVALEISEALAKRGIRFLAYFSVFFDNYALGVNPDWVAVGDDGQPRKHGPFLFASPCSPYRDYMARQLEEFAAEIPADGFWLDIVPLARDVPQTLPMITPQTSPDLSLHARRRYRERCGADLPLSPSDGEADQLYEFMVGETEAFLTECRAALHRHQPEALVTYNGAGAPGDPLDMGDLVSIEGHAPHYSRQSFIARWGRSRKKPTEGMIAGGMPHGRVGSGWNSLDQKPVEMLRLEAATFLAQGASPVFGHVPYSGGRPDPVQLKSIGTVLTDIRDIEPWLVDTQSVADVGILLSAKPRSASSVWHAMQSGAEAVHNALIDENLLFDILPYTEDLSRFPCVVANDQIAMDDAEVKALIDYVHAGGCLIVMGKTASRDGDGRQRTVSPLQDVLGLEFAGQADTEFFYIQQDSERAAAELIPEGPTYVAANAARVGITSAEVMCQGHYPETGYTEATTVLWGEPHPDEERSFPAITSNRFGRGRAIYVAFSPRTDGIQNIRLKRLVQALVREQVARPTIRVTNATGLELTLNRLSGGHALHLVNHGAGNPERWSPQAPGLGVAVEIDLSRLGVGQVREVIELPERALPFELAEGRLMFSVPEVGVHTIIGITGQ